MADDPTPAPTTPSLSTAVSAIVGAPGAAPSATDTQGTVVSLGSRVFIDTQRRIAFMLLWIMIGVIAIITIVSLGYSLRCSLSATTGDACEMGGAGLDLLTKSLSPIFTAMIGLVGSVVGFYFGSKQGGS